MKNLLVIAFLVCSVKADFEFDFDLSDLKPIISNIGNNCVYKCPNGRQPRQNKKFKSSEKYGCGSYGYSVDFSQFYLPEFDDCCVKHDKCYEKCNEKKEDCDTVFQSCLVNSCNNLKITADLKNMCIETANIINVGVQTLGCKAYLDSQKNACTCSHD